MFTWLASLALATPSLDFFVTDHERALIGVREGDRAGAWLATPKGDDLQLIWFELTPDPARAPATPACLQSVEALAAAWAAPGPVLEPQLCSGAPLQLQRAPRRGPIRLRRRDGALFVELRGPGRATRLRLQAPAPARHLPTATPPAPGLPGWVLQRYAGGTGVPLMIPPRQDRPRPLVIGHRGAPGHLPDHTLEGYTLAVEQGADYIEPDLVITLDGHLIARHENDLTHTTDVAQRFPDRRATKIIDGVEQTGFFSEDLTLAEIKTLRAVQPYPDRPHEHDGQYLVPTFREILALAGRLSEAHGRPIGVYPETKHPSYFRGLGLPLEEPLVTALQEHGLTEPTAPVFLQSFELSNLEDLAQQLGVRRVLLIWDPDTTPFGDARTYGQLLSDLPALRQAVHGIGVHKDALIDADGDTGLLQRAHEAGLLVHVYTFRDEPHKLGPAAQGDPRLELQRFYELGVDGVFADYPDTASEVRSTLWP